MQSNYQLLNSQRERERERGREREREIACELFFFCYRELHISSPSTRLEDGKKWSPSSLSPAYSMPDSRSKMRTSQVPRHTVEVCNLGSFEIIGKTCYYTIYGYVTEQILDE